MNSIWKLNSQQITNYSEIAIGWANATAGTVCNGVTWIADSKGMFLLLSGIWQLRARNRSYVYPLGDIYAIEGEKTSLKLRGWENTKFMFAIDNAIYAIVAHIWRIDPVTLEYSFIVSAMSYSFFSYFVTTDLRKYQKNGEIRYPYK